MKYLKYYEAFYSPVKQIFKGNIGNDYEKDTGFNTFPMDSFEVNDEQKAFNEGEKAFNDGANIEDNPYIDQQYPNTNLIKRWEEGWNNGSKNKKIQEEIEIDFAGNMLMPDYLTIDPDDEPNTAFYKGQDAAKNDCDMEENPYTSIDEEENNALKDLFLAWEDGFNSI